MRKTYRKKLIIKRNSISFKSYLPKHATKRIYVHPTLNIIAFYIINEINIVLPV